ncbi:MAG TPA: hypothetical protein VN281_24045 [Verrucomicrobiae bacterium]|jgi:hypothetical protein|nr:hypothetical protein [Verrucomicrobiae bacterium]
MDEVFVELGSGRQGTLQSALFAKLNGSGINRFNDGPYFLLGLALAVFVIVALFTSFVIPLRRQWALISFASREVGLPPAACSCLGGRYAANRMVDARPALRI